jgi:CRP-like cAMP-binding protein
VTSVTSFPHGSVTGAVGGNTASFEKFTRRRVAGETQTGRPIGFEPSTSGALGVGVPVVALAELAGEAAVLVVEQPASVALTRGEVWMSKPESEAGLLVVEEGFVLLSADVRWCNGHGYGHSVERRIVLATGQPGTLFALPAPDERLEALTASRITVISADSVKMLLALPSAAEAIAAALAEAISERQASIRNCAYTRHSERVHEKLLQLARTYGRAVPGGVRIEFPLTHQLLADMVGSARETVSLALSELARAGLLRRQQRCYTLRIGPHELFSTARWSDGAPERKALHGAEC